MLNLKTINLTGWILAAGFLVSACSGDKVLPEGKRISVLDPIAAVKPDVANSSAHISIPASVTNRNWLQEGYNAQHIQSNFAVGSSFQKQWDSSFGKGGSKREFLISKPLIADGRIYTLDAAGLLSAFNLQNGEVLWDIKLRSDNDNVDDTALKGAGIALDNGTIYATTGYGVVYAVSAKKGEILWQKSLQTPLRIAPMVANGNVYIQSVDNKFYALKAASGEEQWKYDISLENTTLVGGAPAAYAPQLDMVVTGFSNGEIQAFNATLGSPLWSDVLISNRQAYSSTFLDTIKSAPVIDGQTVYAIGNSNIVTAIDLRTGMRKWEREIGSISTPLLVGSTLYIVTNANDLVAVNKENGDILWATPIRPEKKSADTIIFSPLMLGGRLVVTLSDGTLQLYMPQTGKLLSTIDVGEELNAAPIVADGYIVFVTTDADLIAYK
ncbi:MAG: PQQ-binding-like beta-propeller repeat protein [Pseudomonadota bacterium]|nr:PQQ-binding-like beta-propeller repeat protein [Pseudomonadota bacterium]